MPYELKDRLVVGVASSAMFDLGDSDKIFRTKGEQEYREYQELNKNEPLAEGIAFSFIKRLLSLNDLSASDEGPLIEVVLLSRNDPDTGLRVMNSIKHHGLGITRAIFQQGLSPYDYIPALSISLFLSSNKSDVLEAIAKGFPAGYVMDSKKIDDPEDQTLRIAFDFDGVLADDGAETVMQETKDVSMFHAHETLNVMEPLGGGPLKEFLMKVSRIQRAEEAKRKLDINYKNRLRVSIVTARNAPSHERAINTLKSWGVMANDAFFLGGVEKKLVLNVMRPHIFFDDQSGHLASASEVAPSVHVPFGIANRA
ncbi:TPA: 5'-nucleotidase [Stenotrophomonas maltophilia]|uniref:5'-nucleotidase n=2 Tax=Bacteria TaxID=2 RepID=UPI000C1454CF|nr:MULTISPECIES: 5'-nucleotidase [Stenotrophomonas]EKT4077229.1 5'-nucleotidase [Stenotrophomonas maltophilia]EKT4084470.1 5'-nucleotidase [Stenotrophomonas maltophilia]MBA0371261.1 5'-nucleotidase [Stenotrophomonas maltophilia]MDA3305572.1 5'-nucleotidase [Stenotrophomonas sp. PI_27]MDQ7309362.1 5'-nucleotidase [Stenotrophomonas sp. Sm3119]